jgi:hypothetical protein
MLLALISPVIPKDNRDAIENFRERLRCLTYPYSLGI